MSKITGIRKCMNKLFTKDMLIRIVLALTAVNLFVMLFRPVIVQHRKDHSRSASSVFDLLK